MAADVVFAWSELAANMSGVEYTSEMRAEASLQGSVLTQFLGPTREWADP